MECIVKECNGIIKDFYGVKRCTVCNKVYKR